MPQDAVLIHQAMAAAGGLARAEMARTFSAFGEIGLAAGERLSAVATAVAAVLLRRHQGDAEAFLDALQDLTRPTAGFAGLRGERSGGGVARRTRIADGAALLAEGFERLAQRLGHAGIPAEQAALVESVLLARLLAEHRPNSIRLALVAVRQAVAQPGFTAGDLVIAAPADAPPEPWPEMAAAS